MRKVPEDRSIPSCQVLLAERQVIYRGLYTIIRVYEVPADTKQQATDRMFEAILSHDENVFHVKDILREPGDEPGQGKEVDLRPARWLAWMREQLALAGKRSTAEK